MGSWTPHFFHRKGAKDAKVTQRINNQHVGFAFLLSFQWKKELIIYKTILLEKVIDNKVDFIKVETQKEGNDFLFVLQDPINKKETQDIAVISVTKDDAGKVSMQIIGDKDLYGKDYIVEPKTKPTAAVTTNPGYTGDDPVESTPASTTVIVVESAPIVQYVYSPAYVPYYPPYYYGYYPPYYAAFTVMAVGIYRHNNWYYHGGYHGSYHGNTNININRNTQINHYNNGNRNTSNTVNNNVKSGNYNTAGKGTNRASTSQTGRATAGNSASTRPSTSQSKGSSSDFVRPSTSQSRTSGASASTRPSSNNYNSGSRSRASSSSYSRPSSMGSISRGGSGRRRWFSVQYIKKGVWKFSNTLFFIRFVIYSNGMSETLISLTLTYFPSLFSNKLI